MSGVDVLAVLDGEIADRRRDGDTGNVENLIEARNAMAELIEAAEQMLAVRFHHERVAAKSRLRAALARCQPAEIPDTLNVDIAAPVAPGVGR